MRRDLLSVLLFLFLYSPVAHATPVSYRIDYTLLAGVPAPAPTFFTYDFSTTLFTGMRVEWPTPPSALSFDFISNASSFSINGFNTETRKFFFTSLMSGGSWSIGDSAFSRDSSIDLNGVSFINLGVSHARNDFAAGTFTTAAVPESSSLLLVLVGVLLLFLWRFAHFTKGWG